MDARRLRLQPVEAGSRFFRVYEVRYGYDQFNPGHGDTRFAPVRRDDGTTVPHLYGGADEEVALLATVFHDVHHAQHDRRVWEADLRERGLAYVRAPRSMRLLDLRDPQLRRLGLAREQLVATSAEHYPCTRRWATWLHARRVAGHAADGLVWHSRQAELRAAAAPPDRARQTLTVPPPDRAGGMPTPSPAGRIAEGAREALLLFGDRFAAQPGQFPLANPGVRNLVEGEGRVLVERLAEDLDALVVPAGQ